MEMSPTEFAAGYTGKILAEMEEEFRGTQTENKLRHLNRLFHYALDTDFTSVLSFNQKFLRGIEQKNNSWESWDKIQYWHSRHLETRKFSSSKKSDKNVGGKGAGEKELKDDKKQKLIEGVPEAFVCASKLCIMFQ